MAIIQADDLADLTLVTLRDLGRLKWTDIGTDLQEHYATSHILRKERVGFDSGYGIQFNVRPTAGNQAAWVGLFEVDDVNVPDVMVQGNVPWRHLQSKFAVERREMAMNRNPARIVELIKLRRITALVDQADLLESAWWGVPTSSTDGLPFGIDYWVTKNATAGFNGGNHANFSAGPANINRDTFTRWRNYTDQYQSVSKDDLIRKLRRASRLTGFMAPFPQDVQEYNAGNRYSYVTNIDVLERIEELAEGQNDDLGPDIASMQDRTLFRKRSIDWIPELDSDTQDPFYGINWGVMKAIFLRGEYMVETTVTGAPQHTTVRTFIDSSFNFVCYDPRRLFVVNTA